MGVLDLLFPKQCVGCRRFGSFLCADCFTTISFAPYDICLVCNRPSLDSLTHPGCKSRYTIDGAFASLVYTGTVKKLLYTFKYKPYLTGLQGTLISLFYEGLIQKETFYRVLSGAVLVPVPLFPAKLRSRGYNQAGILSQGLAEKFGLQSKPALQRIRNTPSQYRLSRPERQKNIKDAFGLVEKSSAIIKEKTILLADDVLTSGSTLSEAAKVLKRGGAKRVFGLALAHGQ